MEDDKGLVLSLGLPCGRTSSPSKDNSGNSADNRTDTDARTSKILNDFRNFLNAGAPQSSQRTDPVKPAENFFNNFQQTTSGGNESSNGSGINENKRKSSFLDVKNHKKCETDSYSSDLQKEKNSHISITTDEGSTGENEEDVADSEAEGSTSRMASHRDDGSRTAVGSASSSQAPKVTDGKSNISASSFHRQTVNTVSLPYAITIIESPSESSPSTPVHPCSLAASTGSVPMAVTYSSVQIPDKDSHSGMARPQPLGSPYTGRLTPTSVSLQATNNRNSSDTARLDILPLDQLREPPKQVGEEGSSSQTEGDAVARSNNSFPSEYPAIRPGIAAKVKFGGSGSSPNLPWVSTTGPGPNGKTISGVTYIYTATQIKIVCACHGIHLSPDEFLRHATQDQPSAKESTVIASLLNSNPPVTSESLLC
ncbi:hypothetical protein RND81_08G049700 [Saponaria officinalis]|uniref:Ninja-family protein n=1 Tax=Saponaria officinalis TaxID=3572 RepID=A0AAW1J452_SAPOF